DCGNRLFGGANLLRNLLGGTDDAVLEFLNTFCASHSLKLLAFSAGLSDRSSGTPRTQRRHVMDLMLNLCEGHVFVELHYPHIIGMGCSAASRCSENLVPPKPNSQLDADSAPIVPKRPTKPLG